MSLSDLTSADGFRAAFAVSLLLTAAVALVAARFRASRIPIPAAGLIVVVAIVVGLRDAELLPGAFVVGELVLVAGVVLAARAPRWVAGPAAVPGALVLASATPDAAPDWAPAFVVAGIAVAAPLVVEFDTRTHRIGVGPPLLAASALGVYLAVPDTEEAAVVVAAAVPVALAGFPVPLASLGGPLAVAPVGLVVAVAAAGGRGRPGAIVGGAACLGVLLLGPLVPDLRDPSFPRRLAPVLTIGALQAVVVAVAARVAATETHAATAAAIAALTLAAAAALVVVTTRLAPVRRWMEEPARGREAAGP